MAWAGKTGSEEDEVAVAMAYSESASYYVYSNGKIQVWDIDRTEIVKEFSGIEGIPRGLGIIRSTEYRRFLLDHSRERRAITCTEDGKVDLFSWNEDGIVDTVYSPFSVTISSMFVVP